MNKKRPINLNLFTIRFPVTAIVSILHRISGFALFALIPVILWAFSCSLTESGFEAMQEWFGYPLVKALGWLLLVPFCYHLTAGLRHLLMDMHVCTKLNSARKAAYMTLGISLILIILAGVWLW